MECEGLADLLLGQHLDEDLAAAHRDVVWDLSGSLGLQSHVSLASVDTFVVAPFDLANTNTKGTDEHGDGGVGDVVRDSYQTDHHGVVADVHH